MNDDAPSLLTATDLVVRHNERVIFDRASLTLREGDRIGLVGRNGCGKSTFLRILAGVSQPDAGELTSRRGLVAGYLSQDFTLDPALDVSGNIRAGARHVLDLIAEFESLPAASRRHEELEHRIDALDGWNLDQRIKTAISRLNVPPPERAIATLSGGEKRRVAICRAIVSRPDLLILDEPTNHLDPEAIEWVAEFLDAFPGTVIVATHDRYFLDRVSSGIVEIAGGGFASYDGGYTDYLISKAEQQATAELVEHKRQMFLRRELAWVRRGPSARRTKSKSRLDRYFEVNDQGAPEIVADMDLVLPPPPQLGNRVVEVTNLGMTIGGRNLFQGFDFVFENGRRVGVAGRNGLGKSTFLKAVIGELPPSEGTVKVGPLTKFNYVDQGRVTLREDRTVYEEAGDGSEVVMFGDERLSLRAYLRRFLFTEDRIQTQVKHLSGGERSRLLLARILKNGGNFLVLDEPTNDLDLPTLRVLEEALLAFPGAILVVSHDRYFLNRICTDILAFAGDGRITHSVGNYDYYQEKLERAASPSVGESTVPERRTTPAAVRSRPAPPAPSRPRKLTWKEAKELEGMEELILGVEAEVARIEGLFSAPDFHRTHATQTNELLSQLAALRADLARHYARWEELEAINSKQAGTTPPPGSPPENVSPS
jgi:ATP-binding cassette subfamily F protein uup